MIILDTNVVSELMRPLPDKKVAHWIASQNQTDLYVTAITIAEITYGIERLPEGKKRDDLGIRFTIFAETAFKDRVLAFDKNAAMKYARIAAACKKKGQNIDSIDLMIAAMSIHKAIPIATRNIKDFEPCGVLLINPWE